ncbi:autotransporter domain-containing protein, partial [uncultured Sphingomonas sp.]|uniref:autotransporter domain-containing protein n=1 Tax=uncultured Sphingomonas sp. TaxID=158754 RepID=UPI0025ED522E
LPAGLTLAADGTLSGTPTTAGNYTVTVTTTDAHGATGTATYSLAVSAPPPPVAANPVTTSVAANTKTEAGQSVSLNLSSLVTGQFDDIRIVTQPAHGTVTISRTLAMRGFGGSPLMAAALAMSSVSVPSQVIAVYTPEAGYHGTDTFQYVAVGPGGTSTPATATIQVVGTAPAARAITASAIDGQPVSIDLTAAASGGPFTAATVTSVSPADQATATIVAGGTADARTFRLQVTPKARFSGTITVGYTLANAFGTSTPAIVTVTVTARPNPAQDANVRAMSDAQAEAARRFSRTQVGNFMNHAETLHGADCARSTNNLRLSSTDLAYQRHMPGQPIEGSAPDGNRQTSRTTEAAARDEAPVEAPSGCGGKVGVWAGGTIDIGTRDAITGRSKVSATTSGVSAGVDLHVAKGVTLGVGGGLGHDRSTIAGGAGQVNSDSQVLAIYGSVAPAQGLFVDGMLARGWLDYSLRRLDAGAGALATADRAGTFTTGALSSGIDRTTGELRWSLYGRAEYMNGRLGRYVEEGAGIYNLRFDDRTLESVTGALGVRLGWQRPLPFGVLTGRLRTEWLHEFTDGTRQGLDYADVTGPSYYSLIASGWSREQLLFAPGIGLTLPSGWDLGIDLGVRVANGERAATTGMQIRKQF